MRLICKYYLLLLAVLLNGCLEPFNPEVKESNKDFLVVDGQVTDLPGPYQVKISKTSSVNDDSQPISGINITIEDDQGITETLEEVSNGIYQTRNLQGEIGKSYRLNFTYEGDQFQSSWEAIEASPQIDSIYYQGEVRETTDPLVDVIGLQFFVDNSGTEDGARYFRYEWEETWRIGVQWPAFFDYVGNDTIQPVAVQKHTCWRYDDPSGINLGSTLGLTENRLSRHKLGFITGKGERFTRRYSILVKQFTLDEDEFLFWKNLQESNGELGSIFDRQPASVSSNIKNLSDPSNIVLGYFSASGTLEKRIFIAPNQVPHPLPRMPMCQELDTLLKSDFGPLYEEELLDRLRNKVFFQFLFSPFGGIEPVGALLSQPSCADCTLKGGVLEKPEFWEE